MSRDDQAAACRRFEELELKAANGTPLTTDEQDFARRHEGECEVCGALIAGLVALQYGGADGVAPSADEVTARRVINGALEAVGRAGPSRAGEELAAKATPDRATGGRPRGALRRAGLSAAVAAVTALVVAAVVVQLRGDDPTLLLSGPPPPPKGAAGSDSVVPVLVAGVVRAGRGVVSVGEPLRPSAELSVGAGRAAIRVGADVTVLLSADTTVRLSAKSAGVQSLRLVVGDIAVAVKPRPGAPRFAVRVADARVTVTGTIFSVRNDARGAEVAVLRGALLITAAHRAPEVVTRTRRYVIGTQRAELLDPERERVLRQRARVLDLLQTDRPARLSLRTDPAGATVRVDGTVLGATPLDASIGEGQRDLELQLSNHTPVRERVLLRSAISYDRDFQLARMPPRPAAVPDDGWRALVRAARSKRTARDWRGAARAYRELIRRYPRRGAARTAHVSLGFIQLEHLRRPGFALASFQRYLAGGRGGALAREAAWGRILALGALGRRKAEKRALRRFLARYPRSVYRRRAAGRLRKLTPDSMGRRTK